MSKTRTRSSSMDNTNDSIPNAASDPLLDYTDSGSSATRMELLYIWINRDETGFIREQGFNFSPIFRFDLKAIDDGQHYELSCTVNPNYPNVWKTGNVVGMTAVVGENGSGKTSVLNYLLRSALYPICKENRPEYLALQDDRNAKNKTIQVYRINDSICIYHNFQTDELTNNTRFQIVNINEEDCNQVAELLNNQTRIYATNGFTCSSSMRKSRGKVDRIVFSPRENNALSQDFFQKITAQHVFRNVPSYQLQYQKEIASCKTCKDFEQLIAVFYFNFLYTDGRAYASFATGNKKLTINTMNFVRRIQERYEGIGTADFVPDSPFLQALSNEIEEYQDWWLGLTPSMRSNPVAMLYLCLIFELHFLSESPIIPFESFDSIEMLSYIADELLSFYKTLDGYQEEVFCYYKVAFDEVTELSKILEDCPEVTNNVPYEDYAFKTGVEICREDNPDAYACFCRYIDRLMKQQYSFVLKYIVIDMPPLSSGEQALQNIFAWLRLPPFYREIVSSESIPIHANVLLLLDEVDLYMHPEWQRKFLKLLSDELTVEYPDKKIQVVISTHSPLVLSDIPAGNIIYLEKNNVKCTLARGPELEESFGSNFFSLLRDSFFLQRSMGEFAYSRITDAIADLNELKKNPENAPLKEKCRDYNRLIGIIGEPVIKRKLHMLYTEIFGNDPDEREERYFAEFSRLLNSDDPHERKKYRARLQKMLSDATDD